MQLLPLNNPTLLRRAGYKDVLKGWGLLRWSSAIRWDGLGTFSGNNRNVAQLYEYWCYLKIADILAQRLEMREAWEPGTPDAVWSEDDGGIKVSLKKGNSSRRYFVSKNARDGTRIVVGLYYNTRFNSRPTGPREENRWSEQSSYALEFQPDITLSIFRVPEHRSASGNFLEDEKKSEKDGTIRHLHFDAKYRLDFTGVPEDGAESATFKKADFEKMLAYNEAIRRTCGAFVLYPGTELAQIYSLAKDRKRSVFFRYEEVIPGVGAFALRPTTDQEGSTNLECFLRDVMREVTANRGKTDDLVVREAAAAAGSDLAVVGYVRPCADAACRTNKIFFAHAKRGSSEVLLDPQIRQGLPLYVHNGGPDIAWSARIEWITTVTRDQLEGIVGSGILSTPDVSRYYLFHLDDIAPFTKPSKDLGFKVERHRPRCFSGELFTRGRNAYYEKKRRHRASHSEG
jgi:hypothetical protein